MTQDEIIRSPIGREQLVALARDHDIDAERLLAEMVCFSDERVDRVISDYMCSHPEALQKLRDCIDAILDEYAELIVRECRYVMDCNKGSDQHTEWNRALSETSDKIKQHFGVE